MNDQGDMRHILTKFFKKLDTFLLPKNRDHEGILPYVMLGYLLFYFFPVIFAEPSWYDITIAGVALILFLVIYFHLYWVRPQRRVFHISMMWLLGATVMPIYYGGSSFIIYAAAMSCQLGTIRRSVIALLLVALATFVTIYVLLTRTM